MFRKLATAATIAVLALLARPPLVEPEPGLVVPLPVPEPVLLPEPLVVPLPEPFVPVPVPFVSVPLPLFMFVESMVPVPIFVPVPILVLVPVSIPALVAELFMVELSVVAELLPELSAQLKMDNAIPA